MARSLRVGCSLVKTFSVCVVFLCAHCLRFRDLPRRQGVSLLRAGISGLSTLRLERCRCVELLLDARFRSQRLLGLLGL